MSALKYHIGAAFIGIAKRKPKCIITREWILFGAKVMFSIIIDNIITP